MTPGTVGFFRGAWIVLRADARIELRTGDATVTSLLFSALVLVITAFGLSGSADRPEALAPAAYWVAISLAANLAVVRSWTRERDEAALDALLLSPIPRASILAGKAVVVGASLLVVEIALAIPAAMLFGVAVPPSAIWILPAALLATFGVAVLGTLFGAMVVGGTSRDLLVGLTVYPLLVPLFLGAVEITSKSLAGVPFSEVMDWTVLLVVFDAIAAGGALWLFDYLVME